MILAVLYILIPSSEKYALYKLRDLKLEILSSPNNYYLASVYSLSYIALIAVLLDAIEFILLGNATNRLMKSLAALIEIQ